MEWRFIPPEIFAERSARLDALLDTQGRERSGVRRSLMTGLVFGRNEADLAHKAGLYGGSTVERLRSGGLMVGSAAEIVDHIGRYAAVGVQRLMLQWLDLDDADGLEQFAASVLPQLKLIAPCPNATPGDRPASPHSSTTDHRITGSTLRSWATAMRSRHAAVLRRRRQNRRRIPRRRTVASYIRRHFNFHRVDFISPIRHQ